MKRSLKYVWNGTKVGSLIGLYLGHALCGKALIRDENRRKKFFSKNIGRYAKPALEAVNFDIEVVGNDPDKFNNKNYLIVCNHMSYLDILCLSVVHPSIFVTSVDMGEVPFLGTIAELGGSIFIERRHRGQVDRDLTVMADTLKAGFDVLIYPEGTSTNGETVLPFKKSLLMSAVQAGVDILPMTVKYVEINGEPFSPKNRDTVCWYGDMPFAPHLLGLLKVDSVKVKIEFLDPIKVTPESTRNELAEKAHAAILANYKGEAPPVPVDWKMTGEAPTLA
jgi:1-acyl-sn-glycerol-3-phosphate acyltransferase